MHTNGKQTKPVDKSAELDKKTDTQLEAEL